MDELSQYHDAATRSVSVARMLWLLAEAARRDIPLSEVVADACNDNQKQGIPGALEALPAGMERKLSELDAALTLATAVPDAVRLTVMRAGCGECGLLGVNGVSMHEAAIALGRQLLPERRLPKEDGLPLLDLATARMVNMHSAHKDAYHCLKEAESALEAERLGAAEALSTPPTGDDGGQTTSNQSGRVLPDRLVAVLGPEETRIVQVASDSKKTVEQRMMEIVAIDRGFLGKDSVEWGTLLDCTSAAIRKLDFWEVCQESPDKAYQHAVSTHHPA